MKWIIGIDLGTTNCTLSCAQKKNEVSVEILKCPISQKIAPSLEGESFFLPSFLYIPLPEEGKESVAGQYAKERGIEVSDRVISSAKSWLCHDAVDCRNAFLPLGGSSEKRSPIETLAIFLKHLKENWEKHFSAPFHEQSILITVPASFDPRARELVLESSRQAGYPTVVLMEEPLAAFYAWLYKNETTWRDQLKVGQTVLVVDCGGGTTDFSLIRVENREGELTLERKSVGDHLLLGGDNFDLALAYFAQEKFDQDLDEWQFQSLIHACRDAKESLLGADPLHAFTLTLPGRGSSLIGGMLQAKITREEVEEHLLNHFFPEVDFDVELLKEKRLGIKELGLPFVQDARITAQLAVFLKKSGEVLPSAVLFNGGTMKAASFRKKILDQLRAWSGHPVAQLEGEDLDFGVSQGAVYYDWTKGGKGLRVRAASTKSYFIGVEGMAPAVPGIQPPLKAICIAPYGVEEGSEITLPDQHFSLTLEEPAVFRFFSLNAPVLPNGTTPVAGTTVRNWKECLQELHPIETFLKGSEEGSKAVEVSLKAKITELGFLELWCVDEKSAHQWKLEFNIR